MNYDSMTEYFDSLSNDDSLDAETTLEDVRTAVDHCLTAKSKKDLQTWREILLADVLAYLDS